MNNFILSNIQENKEENNKFILKNTELNLDWIIFNDIILKENFDKLKEYLIKFFDKNNMDSKDIIEKKLLNIEDSQNFSNLPQLTFSNKLNNIQKISILLKFNFHIWNFINNIHYILE